jgi:hypothetical protein
MASTRLPVAALLLYLTASVVSVSAQSPSTGGVSGRVLDPTGLPLAGVAVTAMGPSSRDTRTTLTGPTGDYGLTGLLPTEYLLSFDLQGFHSEQQKVRVIGSGIVSLDITLNVEAIPETVRVTSDTQTAELQHTRMTGPIFKTDALDRLPVGTLFENRVTLSAGVTTNGPNGAISMSGAMSYGNLFLIDGFVINENLRGLSRPFLLPDATQETRVAISNISAEYGRFQGGVINTVTKTGGNRFSGTVRTAFSNDRWRALTPHPRDTRLNHSAPAVDLTLGGPLLRDRVFFFGASQFERSEQNRTLPYTGINYTYRDRQQRYQAKLTWTPTSRQTVKLNYFGVAVTRTNVTTGTVMDRSSFYDSRTPEALYGINYTALLGSTLLLEGQYSNRQMTVGASGAGQTDLIGGTPIWDRSRSDARFNSPAGCAVCGGADDERDNQNIVAKVWYVWSTRRAGSHELIGGVDLFQETRRADAYQSGSGFRVRATRSVVAGEQVYPVLLADRTTWIYWTPILKTSVGNDLRTYSAFASDTWRMSARWTLKLGLRFDRSDDEDSLGVRVIHGSTFSPRLAVLWDPSRNGAWILSAGLSRYEMSNNTNIVDAASSGGRPATYVYDYLGPAVNATTSSQPTTSADALKVLFDWFNANGSTTRATRSAPSIPGVTSRIDAALTPPNATEFTLGVTRTVGSRGSLRVDGVYRRFGSLYGNRRDMTTGKVTDSNGARYDLLLVTNAAEATRTYAAINAQLSYRLSTKLQLAGTYTCSRARGNSDGESTTIGPDAASIGDYPEYRQVRWNAPEGWLSIDQRHKLRVWATWDLTLPKALGRLTTGVVQRADSGRPWSAVANINPTAYVTNPGYVTPPTSVVYYFTPRGQFRMKTITATDLSLMWSRRMPLTRRVQMYGRAMIVNVFNQAGIDGVGRSVLTRNDNTSFLAFNPFVDTPVRGVNYEYGQDFGKPTSPSDYQPPRQLSLSVGARF